MQQMGGGSETSPTGCIEDESELAAEVKQIEQPVQ